MELIYGIDYLLVYFFLSISGRSEKKGSVSHIIFLFNRGVPPRAPRIRSDAKRSKRNGIHEDHRADYPISPCRIRYFRPAVIVVGAVHAFQGEYCFNEMGMIVY